MDPIKHRDIPASYVSLPEGTNFCFVLQTQSVVHESNASRFHGVCVRTNVRFKSCPPGERTCPEKPQAPSSRC